MINDLVKIIKQAENNGFDLCIFCIKHKIPFVGLCDGIIHYMNKRNMIDLLLLNKEFNKCYWGEPKLVRIDNGIYCDHERIADSFEDLQKGMFKLPESQLKKLKLHGCILISDYIGYEVGTSYKTNGWQYYLQQVVLENNKVEYFKRGLKQ